MPRYQEELSTTAVAKKVLTSIFVYALLCLLIAVGMNRGFMTWRWSDIFSHRRMGGGFVVIFLLLFPILYIWQIKSLAIADTLNYLRGRYRNEIVDLTVEKTIIWTRETRENRGEITSIVAYIHTLRNTFPGVVKRVVDLAIHQFHFFQKIPEILQDIDISNPDDTVLKQQILFRLESYIPPAPDKPSVFSSSLRKVTLVNIVALIAFSLLL